MYCISGIYYNTVQGKALHLQLDQDGVLAARTGQTAGPEWREEAPSQCWILQRIRICLHTALEKYFLLLSQWLSNAGSSAQPKETTDDIRSAETLRGFAGNQNSRLNVSSRWSHRWGEKDAGKVTGL